MIRSLHLIRSDCTDPYRNLALEKTLLESVREGQCILYLWQNERTVVIGRNQNAYAECSLAKLERDGGHLARRLSGGGAVFHDLGNLNFTFLTKTPDADRERETEVILDAVRSLGIRAERNGRNDLICEGRKFSGHAYYRSGDASFHHGTVMISVDPDRLSSYLTVSPVKLEKRSVASVRSRVINLTEVRPDLTPALVQDALEQSFARVCGLPCETLEAADLDPDALDRSTGFFASRDWILGKTGPLPYHVQSLFPDGIYRLDYEVLEGTAGTRLLGRSVLSTDSLDAVLDRALTDRLYGCPLSDPDILQALGNGADTPTGRVLIRLTDDMRRNCHV